MLANKTPLLDYACLWLVRSFGCLFRITSWALKVHVAEEYQYQYISLASEITPLVNPARFLLVSAAPAIDQSFLKSLCYLSSRRRTVCQEEEAGRELGGGRDQRGPEQAKRLRRQVYAGQVKGH